jgi:hypothetical protein
MNPTEVEILMLNWALNHSQSTPSRIRQLFRMRMQPFKQTLQLILSHNIVFLLLRLKSLQTKTARCLGTTHSKTHSKKLSC